MSNNNNNHKNQDLKSLCDTLNKLENDCNLLFDDYSKRKILESNVSKLIELIDNLPSDYDQLVNQWNGKLKVILNRYSNFEYLMATSVNHQISNAVSCHTFVFDDQEIIENDLTEQLIYEMEAIEFVVCKMIHRNILHGVDAKLRRLTFLLNKLPIGTCATLLDSWKHKLSILEEEYINSQMAVIILNKEKEFRNNGLMPRLEQEFDSKTKNRNSRISK